LLDRIGTFLVNADEVANLRRHGACELHRICADLSPR
jgi:hypothetical protein